MRSRSKPDYQLKIAMERIQILFNEAENVFKDDPKLAKRYIELARRIGMRYNVRIPRDLKRKYCKHCHAFLRFGVNAQLRLKSGAVIIKCFSCNKTTHYPYKGEKGEDFVFAERSKTVRN